MDVEEETVSDIENIEIEEGWKAGCSQLIPFKSRQRYETAYKTFKNWLDEKNGDINEKSLLAYFVLRNATLKSPSSLWAEYSMVRTTINLNDNIDISKFTKLIAFLKMKNIGHRPKKSKTFTKEQMNRFLKEAPDETYLMMKVVMVMGIAGACRREELVKMTTDDILDQEKVVIVTIPNTKTHVPRTFTVVDQPNEEIKFVEILRQYIKLRPPNAPSKRLFYAYRNGKCVNQVVGINTMGKIPSKIAEYLHLENSASYTGHAFRRTSATLLANAGVDVLGLKRHGGWKSSSVAESYVGESVQNKIEFSKKILYGGKNNDAFHGSSSNVGDDNTVPTSVQSVTITENSVLESNNININNTVKKNIENPQSVVPITFNNCTNCSFNFHVNK